MATSRTSSSVLWNDDQQWNHNQERAVWMWHFIVIAENSGKDVCNRFYLNVSEIIKPVFRKRLDKNFLELGTLWESFEAYINGLIIMWKQ